MPKNLHDFKPYLTEYVNQITEPSPDGAKNKYICPLCASGTGSNRSGAFSIKEDGLTWKCFSCGAGGDITDLVKALNTEIITTPKALEYLRQRFGGSEPKIKGSDIPKSTAQIEKEERLKIWKRYKEDLQRHPEAIAYLNGRGITSETIKRAGLGYYETEKGKFICFPYDKNFSYYAGRSIENNPKKQKHDKAPTREFGSEPIYNKGALSGSKPCFITEAIICALSIIQESDGRASAVSIGGKTGIQKIKNAVASGTVTAPALVIALDNEEDKTTREQAEKLKDYIDRSDKYSGSVIIADYMDFKEKDPNDLLQAKNGALKAFIDGALSKYEENEKNAKESELIAINSRNAVNLWDHYIENEYKNTKIIKTEWGELDKYLGGGIYPSLYVLGAGSSVGKTTFLVQLADMIAINNDIRRKNDPNSQDNHILFFSLEQSAPELISKSIARLVYESNKIKTTGITAQDILIQEMNSKLDPKKRDLAEKVYQHVYAPFGKYIYYFEAHPERIGVKDIREEVEKHIKNTGINPVVFIDYLQILKPFDEDKNIGDRERLDHNISELKKISANYNIPVFVLSSINRNSYDVSPGMESLKGSGGIEYGADIVLSLEPAGVFTGRSRENRERLKEHRLSEESRSVILNIHKNRNGSLSYKGKVLYCLFEPKYSYFGLEYLAKPAKKEKAE